MPIVVIDTQDLTQLLQNAVATAIQPLQQQLQALQLKSDGKELLTVKEFAAKTRLSTKTVTNYCNDGKLHFNQAKEGAKILIPITELLKFKQC